MFALSRPKYQGLLQGEHREILAQSAPCWFERRRHSIANCGRMVTYTSSATVTMVTILFRMVPSPIPYGLLFPKMGFHMPQDTRMAISPQRVIRYTGQEVRVRIPAMPIIQLGSNLGVNCLLTLPPQFSPLQETRVQKQCSDWTDLTA